MKTINEKFENAIFNIILPFEGKLIQDQKLQKECINDLKEVLKDSTDLNQKKIAAETLAWAAGPNMEIIKYCLLAILYGSNTAQISLGLVYQSKGLLEKANHYYKEATRLGNPDGAWFLI